MSFTRPTALTAAIALSAVRFLPAEDAPDFARDVRPILAKNCFTCHGPDDETREGGFRLDVAESVRQPADSGAVPIVPESIGESELIRRIFSDDESEQMPPPDSNLSLSDAQRETLRNWVAAGAEYTPHWAFVRPMRPAVPAVSESSRRQNEIDDFIQARLEAEGLSLSPLADRATLIRRVSLDLIGLPPMPDEVDTFVNDHEEGAYERLVERLLKSPHYGERWARRWLDLARYADTNGYEKDRPRSIWPYRDWVINALNEDMPFDQFTIEQLAGDMLPDATVEQRIATGFHRNTMLNEEGGIDPLEFRFHAMTDRVATTGTTWLGLTLGCAQCHSHKYDPISQREYYQLMAYLDNADEPDLNLPDPALDEQHRQNLERADQLLTELADRWPLQDADWETPRPVAAQSEGDQAPQILEDGSVLFASPGPETDVATIVLETDVLGIDRLRIEALTDESLPRNGPGLSGGGNFVLNELIVTAQPLVGDGAETQLKFARAEADAEQEGLPVAQAIDGKDETGWAVYVPNQSLNTKKTAVFFLESPVEWEAAVKLTLSLRQLHGQQHTIGRVRVSLGSPIDDPRPESERRREVVAQEFAAWIEEERERTVAWTPLTPVEMTSNLPLLTLEEDDVVFVSGDTTKLDTYELTYRPELEGITAIRLEALPDERLPAHGPGMTFYEGTKGDFFLGEFQLTADAAPVAISDASESYAKNRFGTNPVAAALCFDGNVQTGWSVHQRMGERHTAIFLLQQPLEECNELKLKMIFGRHFASSLGKFRLSATADPRRALARDLTEEVESLLALPADDLDEADLQTLRTAFLLQAPELAEQTQQIRNLRMRPAATTTLVMLERPPENPRPTHIHHRGEFLQPTEQVEGAVPEFLESEGDANVKDRLAFARWLVSPDNPLTARVAVNRQWAAFFGRGIVATQEDFGIQGQPPTHPDLLDWLTVQFIEDGWSMKRLHKRIVMSGTYRQSSNGHSRTAGGRPGQSAARPRTARQAGGGSRPRLDPGCQRFALTEDRRPQCLPTATCERHHGRHLRCVVLDRERRRGPVSAQPVHLQQADRAVCHVCDV